MLFLLYIFGITIAFPVIAICCLILLIRTWMGIKSGHTGSNNKNKTLTFFHPYCHAGGGGERVLWTAIRASLQSDSNLHCIIYSGDRHVTPTFIFDLVNDRFGISIDRKRVSFVFLRLRWLIEPATYPRFTLIGQSLGSIALVCEAILRLQPSIFIDTMGYAFTYPIVYYLIGCKILAYTHYPTISNDMLRVVQENCQSINNSSLITNYNILKSVKLVYYRLFSKLYAWCGRHADIVMTNSTWTHNHICTLWNIHSNVSIVYPPCDTRNLETLPLPNRKPWILSVAQFRPEKNHILQLHVLAELISTYPNIIQTYPDIRLIMVGGCRSIDDNKRADLLMEMAIQLGIHNYVTILRNVSLDHLMKLFGESMIGIHTMVDEHFGISVVEAMAAGLITIAHNSAGPRFDIIHSQQHEHTGYLAQIASEYASCIYKVLSMSTDDKLSIQVAARTSVRRFSESAFTEQWIQHLNLIGVKE